MTVRETTLPGVLVVERRVFRDDRGWFAEAWNQERYRDAGLDATFVQDNVSCSRRGVVRGLHAQNPHSQGKLVSVVHGEVFDVAVDVRWGSETFGKWVGRSLSESNGLQMWIPPGFAHGFVATSRHAVVSYKSTDRYAPGCEFSVRWDDPEIGVRWPVATPVLSEKDAQAPLLRDVAREQLAFPFGTDDGDPGRTGSGV